jgi:hypothetical protein
MHNPETSRPKDEAIDSEATSKDTLKDIDANEEESDSQSSTESNAPSPDGQLDEKDEQASLKEG